MVLAQEARDPRTAYYASLVYLDFFFTALFTVEMLLKIYAYGLFIGQEAYVKSPWNLLDGGIVIVCLLDIAITMFMPGAASLSMFRAARGLRVLRPLRLIQHNQNLRVVVDTLFKSVPELVSLGLVAALFYLIFALFAVSVWKGRMGSCTTYDPASASFEDFDFNASDLETLCYLPD